MYSYPRIRGSSDVAQVPDTGRIVAHRIVCLIRGGIHIKWSEPHRFGSNGRLGTILDIRIDNPQIVYLPYGLGARVIGRIVLKSDGKALAQVLIQRNTGYRRGLTWRIGYLGFFRNIDQGSLIDGSRISHLIFLREAGQRPLCPGRDKPEERSRNNHGEWKNGVPVIEMVSKEDLEVELPQQEIVKGARILIVEDNPYLQKMLADIFGAFYEVSTASDGEEGLEKVKAEMPNLVLSDIVMPRMTGTELCKAIKSDIDTCHIPVVLLTLVKLRPERDCGWKTVTHPLQQNANFLTTVYVVLIYKKWQPSFVEYAYSSHLQGGNHASLLPSFVCHLHTTN